MSVSDFKCTFRANVYQHAAAYICYFKTLIKKNIAFHLPHVIYVPLYEIGVRMLITVFWVAPSIGTYNHEWVLLKQRKEGNTTKQTPFSELFRFKYHSRSLTFKWDLFFFIYLITGTSCLICCIWRSKEKKSCVFLVKVTVVKKFSSWEWSIMVPLCGWISLLCCVASSVPEPRWPSRHVLVTRWTGWDHGQNGTNPHPLAKNTTFISHWQQASIIIFEYEG